MIKPARFAFATFALLTVFFAVFVSFLLSPTASAHHVLGFELSPAFELLHSFLEPFFFACSAASLVWFLRNNKASFNAEDSRQGDRTNLKITSASFVALFTSTLFAAFLAVASLLEGDGALFLLYDAAAFVVVFALFSRLFSLPRHLLFRKKQQ